MLRRPQRVLLVAPAITPQLPGGVRLRWAGLQSALSKVSSVRSYGIACDQFTGCAAGCPLSDHRSAAAAWDESDPFAVHYCQKLADRLLATVAADRIQVAVFTNIQSHRYARELATRGGCRVVYDMHNVEYPLWQQITAAAPARWRDAFYPAGSDAAVFRAEAAVIEAADQVWVPSADDQARARAIYPAAGTDKFRIVPNAVPVPRRLRPDRCVDHVIFTGRFDYFPNMAAARSLLEEIVPALRGRGLAVPVVIAGAAAGHLLRGAAAEGVQIIADPPEMAALLRGGALTVPLTLGGGTRFKILEAAALGVPVVSTGKGAEGLAMTPGRHYLRAEQPDEFADAISVVLSDEQVRRRLAAAAFGLVRREYSIAALAAALRPCLAALR